MKRDLKKLAVLGLSSGLLISTQLSADSAQKKTASSNASSEKNTSSQSETDANEGNLNYHMMTESELMLELNEQGQAMYKSLDSNGKGLALYVASMMCNNTNPCQGLNACQTKDNDCAGKGACKGKGKCAASDKNLAVKLVYDKMNKKRENAHTRP